jgi:hypothetical protein
MRRLPTDELEGGADTASPTAVGRTMCEEPAEGNEPKTPHAPPRAIPRRDRPPSRDSQAFPAVRMPTGRSEHRPQQQEPAVHEIRMATSHTVSDVTGTKTGSNATNRKGPRGAEHPKRQGRSEKHQIRSGRDFPRDIKSEGAGANRKDNVTQEKATGTLCRSIDHPRVWY